MKKYFPQLKSFLASLVLIFLTVSFLPAQELSAPSSLTATANGMDILLNWNENGETDFLGDNIRQSMTQGGPYQQPNSALLAQPNFADTNLARGAYFFVASAVGTTNNESDFSSVASASSVVINRPGFPINLQGENLPEQATINLDVKKPSNAIGSVTLTLMVLDADSLDEGKLEINGAGPIQLFGSHAFAQNNHQVIPITLTTSVDWWNDGRNTLRFVHWGRDGFRIDGASVEFETMPSGLPIDLQGKNLPEQANANLYVDKPSNATGSATLTLMVLDADSLDEGELEINGTGPIQLFGPQVSFRNDGQIVPITLTTPVDWWNDERNTLRFVHWGRDGFRIDSASVEFETKPIGFPIVLRGNDPPEEATVNMNVTKPSGSTGNATLSLMVFDADTPDEGQLEINGNGPIQLFGDHARLKTDRKTVPITLTTLADWWNDGINTIRFIHTRTDGYRIESASVKFEIPLSSAKNINHPLTVSHTANSGNGSTSPNENFQASTTNSDEIIISDGWIFEDGKEFKNASPNHISERPGGDTAGIVVGDGDDSGVQVSSSVNIEETDNKNAQIAAEIQVGKWRRHVITLNNSTYSGNPFELEVDCTFTHTNSEKEISLPGYYSGEGAWSVAFMPTLIGKWTYETSSADPDLDGVKGLISCIDSGHPGMLKADTEHPRKWKYTDGSYVVPVGLLFSVFLEPGDSGEFTSVADFLKNDVSGHLFNFRLTNLVFADDWRDHEFDLALWDRLEERMEILSERGLGVQIMPYTDDAGKPEWEGQTDTEILLIRYMVARLAAYPVVKFNTGVDIFEFRDQAWVDWYGTQVQSLDPYDHPVSSRYGGGSGNLVMTTQTFESREARTPKINELTNFFEATSVPISVDDSWSENSTSRAMSSPSDIRRAFWKAVMAGGVAIHVRDEISSSHSSANDPDLWFHVNDIASALESEQWLRLVNPFIQTKLGNTFGAMVPENSLVANGFALADPSRTKILCYLLGVNDKHDNRNWSAVTVNLPGPGTEYNASWFDPRTGQETLIGNFGGGNNHAISPPSSDDWVLLLEQIGSSMFPLVLQGQDLPEEATVNLNVNKPSNAVGSAALTLMVFDANTADEGELEINGNNPIQLFCDQERLGNDGKIVPIMLDTPANWWNDGNNTLRFVHTRTSGYRIDSASVDFEIPISSEKIPTSFSGSEVPEFPDSPTSRTVYEDAEDGFINGWFRYNSGVVKNIKGGANGSMRAIEIIGDRESDVFRLGNKNGSNWNNSKEFFAEFSVAFESLSSGVIYFQIATSEGTKNLIYTNGEVTNNKNSDMIYFNLGDLAYGQWHTIRRDLKKDLMTADPNVKLKTVKGLFVYGSLKLDNLMLLNYK